MRRKVASPDIAVAQIADRQHGVIAYGQLLECGVTPAGVARRLRAGRLHRCHRAVYAVGHRALSAEGRYMAAILACARRPPHGGRQGTVLEHRGAALSHLSAARLWGLIGESGDDVDVSVPGNGGRARHAGIRLHRRRSLVGGDVTSHHGLPVTTPARTIVDLGVVISERQLRRAVREANVMGLPIAATPGVKRSRSELEWQFLRLCRRQRLPEPEVNIRVGPYLVDFIWRDRRLVIETDGYRYHRGRTAFEDDRGRDLVLRSLGFDVIRLTRRQIDAEPDRVISVLQARLD